jgi:hypothetical protein
VTSKNQALLEQITSFERMERGKITILRQGANGPYYSHQSWENGKNVCKYVPADKVESLQEAIDNYEQYQKLTRAYAEEIIAQTRAETASDSKKNSSRKSRSRKMPKSSS